VQGALAGTPGLVWHGGVPREDVARIVGGSTLAISARASELDGSLELSTKVLEYGQAGVPVVLNRTEVHERMLGVDYPYFIDAIDRDLERVMRSALSDAELWAVARRRCMAVAAEFTFDRVYERLAGVVELSAPIPQRGGSRPIRAVVAGHDLKFFSAIESYLSRAGIEIRIDRWGNADNHDVAMSEELLAWADVVVCEWCLGNAVWYSTHKRAGQRLIIRLHRVEIGTEYPARVQIDAVDRVVVVSADYKRLVLERTGWRDSIVQEIANDVDVDGMDRPKLDGADHHLALVGYVPRRKRLDRALDLLESLRRSDPRWRLFLKGKAAWDLPWIWRLPEEREFFVAQLERIRSSRLLCDAVSFEPFGTDIGSFFRKIGFVLSPSDDESFHVGLAEGMAARSAPVIWNWPGASSLYPAEWIVSSTDDAARLVTATLGEDWTRAGQRARDHVAKRFDRLAVCREWAELIASVVDAAPASSAKSAG
jgi:glycosyltransferase involved in cell wall biosynthesis